VWVVFGDILNAQQTSLILQRSQQIKRNTERVRERERERETEAEEKWKRCI